MQLFIPVTLVSTREIKYVKAIESHDHKITPPIDCNNLYSNNIPPSVIKIPQSQSLPFSTQNNNLLQTHQKVYSNFSQSSSRSKYFKIYSSMSCPDPTSQKSCKQQLQKKSTQSSLNEQLNLQISNQQNQNSLNYLNTQTQVSNLQKHQNLEENLQTQSDVLPQLIYSCKICLQTSNQSQYDPVNNPILKLCNCIDYVHMKCIEAWITRRDVINQEIEPNQCEICLAFYEIDLQLESFLSVQIFYKHLKSDPKGLLCQLVPSLVLFALTIVGIWVLGGLIARRKQEGGEFRASLGMPYGTCVAIFIFLEFILCLILGIFFYSWIRQYLLDLKFKVKVIKREKSQSNHLKTMFKNIK